MTIQLFSIAEYRVHIWKSDTDMHLLVYIVNTTVTLKRLPAFMIIIRWDHEDGDGFRLFEWIVVNTYTPTDFFVYVYAKKALVGFG